MPSPFYLAIKGTTAGAPGTGSFTPNAASSGYRAWSTVPSGWMGLVRYEEGSSWELHYGYWNGTVITRPTAIVASSSGSAISFTAAATAEMVIDPQEVTAQFGNQHNVVVQPQPGVTAITTLGLSAPSVVGVTAQTPNSTNLAGEHPRVVSLNVAAANAICGLTWSTTSAVAVCSATAGRGGWMFTTRAAFLLTGSNTKVHVGMVSSAAGLMTAVATQPSALTSNYACVSKDTTDTNLQFLVNNNSGSGTKIDTGLPYVATDLYEITLWSDPGSLTVYCLLMNLVSGAIYYGSTATDVPIAGSFLFPNLQAAVGATSAAQNYFFCGMALRCGA